MRADAAPLKSVLLHMMETANGCNTQLVRIPLLPGQTSTELTTVQGMQTHMCRSTPDIQGSLFTLPRPHAVRSMCQC